MAKMIKKVKDECLKGIERNRSEYDRIFVNFINDVKKADTIEKYMELKQFYLKKLVMNIPIYVRTCYFCMLHSNNCKFCEYAKIHGECQTGSEAEKKKEKLPSWDKICRAKNRLIKTIDDEYYHGEDY